MWHNYNTNTVIHSNPALDVCLFSGAPSVETLQLHWIGRSNHRAGRPLNGAAEEAEHTISLAVQLIEVPVDLVVLKLERKAWRYERQLPFTES